MDVVRKQILYSNVADRFDIVFLGDLHVGNKTTEYDSLHGTLKWIKRNNAFWIGMGDYSHAIIPSPEERRFDFDELDRECMTPDEQYRRVCDLLYSIRGKGLLMLTGNHDDVLRKRHGHDYVDALAYKLKIPYAGISGFLRLQFKRDIHIRVLDLYLHHGFFTGRTKGAKISRVTELAQIFDADVYVMGHVHDLDHTTNVVLQVDKAGKVVECVKHFLVTGGYMRGYVSGAQSYIEQKMMKPTRLGSLGLRVWPESGGKASVKLEVFEVSEKT